MSDIPENTLLQLHGLKALARRHNQALEDIGKAAKELCFGSVDDSHGHCSDFAYDDDITPEELWERTESARSPE